MGFLGFFKRVFLWFFWVGFLGGFFNANPGFLPPYIFPSINYLLTIPGPLFYFAFFGPNSFSQLLLYSVIFFMISVSFFLTSVSFRISSFNLLLPSHLSFTHFFFPFAISFLPHMPLFLVSIFYYLHLRSFPSFRPSPLSYFFHGITHLPTSVRLSLKP